MRLSPLVAASLLTLCVSIQAPAQAVLPVDDADRQEFDLLFADKLAAVERTRDTADDAKLAGELGEFAESIPDSPGVQRLIYAELIPLAAGAGDLERSLGAARKLRVLSPDDPAAADDTLLLLCERAYREASRTDRPAVAEPYLRLLVELAEHAELERDASRGLDLCRQASTIARTVDSPRRAQIEKLLNRLVELNTIESRIAMLRASVRNNPRNTAAAHELTEMLMVHHGDPSAALAYAPLSGDPDLADVVAMSTDGPENASASAALRVGDWYVALANQEGDDLAEPLLGRARDWYARFLEVYPRSDALADRVKAIDGVLQSRISRFADARRQAMRGQWINLLAEGFDPERHALGETLAVRAGKLYTDGTGFVLPDVPGGDYELRLRFTLEEGNEGLTIHLPVGDAAATVRYAWFGLRMSMINGINARDDSDRGKLRPGQEVELILQAAVLPNNELAVAMLVDGVESLRWRGPAGRLVPDRNHLPPAEMGRAIRVTCPARYTFHAIELRERVAD